MAVSRLRALTGWCSVTSVGCCIMTVSMGTVAHSSFISVLYVKGGVCLSNLQLVIYGAFLAAAGLAACSCVLDWLLNLGE